MMLVYDLEWQLMTIKMRDEINLTSLPAAAQFTAFDSCC